MTERVRKVYAIPLTGETLPSASLTFGPLETKWLPTQKQRVLFTKVKPKVGDEYTLIVGYKIQGSEKFEPKDHPGTRAIEVFLPTEKEREYLGKFFTQTLQRPVQFFE